MPAEVVFAAALSHSPLMFVPGVDAGTDGDRYAKAVQTLRDDLASVSVDTVLMIFPDHFRAARYDAMPAFCIGLRNLRTWGDWYLPRLELTVDTPLAAHVLDSLIERDFDPAFSVDLRIDHGGAQPVEVLGLEDTAIVPVLLNCAAPPLPPLRRTLDLGRAIASALATFPDDRRVAVIGSGGLSHHVPLPSWSELDPSDPEPWKTFVTGIPEAEMAAVEKRRVTRIVSMLGTTQTKINPELDHQVLDAFERGALEDVAELNQRDLVERAGSGMSEIRPWLAAAGAASSKGGRVLEYVPVPVWATGMGVMRLDGR